MNSWFTDFKDVVRRFGHDLKPINATGGHPVLPLGVLFVLNAADELDRVAFVVLLPEIRDYYGASLTSVLTVVSLSTVMVLLLGIPVGFLADRWSRTRMLSAGATTWGVFSILTAFAPNLFMLGAFRFGSGMGKTLDPAQQSLLSDWYPPHVRGGVFSFHQLGNAVGQFAGPLLAGFLATRLFWQAPFLLFGFIGFIGAALVLVKLRDPVRGAQERIAAGFDPDAPEESPPSWAEAWRTSNSVRTLRRVWLALPLLVGAGLGALSLLGVYLEEVFGLSAGQRGALLAFNEPFQIAGILVGGTLANRFLMRGRPGRLISYAGLMAVLGGGAFLVIALVPFLAVVVVMAWAYTFTAAIFVPATLALMSLVIPPKVRGFALGLGAVFVAPGLLMLPVAGALADRFGARAGVLFFVPVYLIGAILLTSAGASVEGDMRAAFAAAAAATITRKVGDDGARTLLVCRDLDVHYGQVQILFGVDFSVDEGEIVALLGTNGAGKSTLLNAIAGLAQPSNGAVNFAGEDITHLPTNEHAKRGIVIVPGGKGVFPSLTVAENLRLASWMSDDEEQTRAALERVLTFFPRLRERTGEAAGNLSGGEQQMLVLGQAFLSKPKLLMIDELSLGLAPAVVEQLLEIVRAIHDDGTTIILVEQSVNVALTVAHRAVFMEKGEVRFSGPTEDLLQRTDILRSVFLAGSASASGTIAAGPRRLDLFPTESPTVALEIRDLRKSYGGVIAVDGASFTLDDGAILGLIGPNGAGKTTIFDLISGFVEPDDGRILLLGDDVTEIPPDVRALRGLQRSFQDAKLFPALTVEENILVALDRHLSARSPVLAGLHLPAVRKAEAKLQRRVERLVELLGLGEVRGKFVRELSTGSRRLIDLACVLAAEPKVLLLDEPSSGVAQRETEELGPLLQRVKYESGCSVLIIEHDMTLVSSIADELLALDLGRVITRGAPRDVLDHPAVVESYLGTDQDLIRRSGSRS